MGKTAQILLLLLVAVAVQSYGGRHNYRGRSHGRFRNPYDYYHHRRHSGERPHGHSSKYHQTNPRNPGDLADSSHIARHPAEPDTNNAEDIESSTPADLSVPSSVDNSNPDSDDLVPDSGVNNDKPDDVSNVIENGESPDSVNSDKPNDDTNVEENGNTPGVEVPDNIDDNINADVPSSEENTIDVNGMSPGGEEDNPNPNDSDNNSADNLNVDQPIISENPQDSIEVNGLEPGDNEGSLLNESPHGENSGENSYLNNDKTFPEDKNNLGHDSNNIDNGELQPNGNDGDINVDGLSPGEDSHEPKDDDNDNSGYDSIDVNGLSPGSDNSESDNNNININGLSPGGDDANGPGIDVHGGLSNDVLGKPNLNDSAHGFGPDNHHHQNHDSHNTHISDNNDGFPSGHASIGAHVDVPNISGPTDLGGLLPKPLGNIFDHGGLKPELKPNLSGNIDAHFIQPKPGPDMVQHPIVNHGVGHLDIDQPQIRPISPGNDILPNPDDLSHIPKPDVSGRPDEILSAEIPDLEDNEGKKNNSTMIPVLLPGGGHIMVHAGALGNVPSYIIVKINGQPTLIQTTAGMGVGGGNAGSLDLSNLILGGGIHGGVLPSWLNLGGLSGSGGVSIGSGGNIGILPNTQPIWISSQLPNFGGGGGATGSFIIPNNEPVQPVPVPVPVPRPMPPPQPIYPTPQPIVIPEPIDPGFSVNPYPGFPWPSNWNPNVNVNVTHTPLTPNQGPNIDWKSLFELLANIDSHLPKPQPPRTNEPAPQPNYPLYPYPYIYPPPPPPMTYPVYPYLPEYLYPKPTGSGKSVPNGEDISGNKDPSNPVPREPRPVPLPEQPRPVPLPEQPRPVPLPEEPLPALLPEEPHYKPLPEEPHPIPIPEEPHPVPLPEEPHSVPLPEEPRPVPPPEEIRPFPEEPHPIPNLEEPHPEPNPEEPHSVPVPEEPRPVPPPEEIRPLPEEPHPIPNLEEPHPEPNPEEPHSVPVPEEPRPVPPPEEIRPFPEEPHPEPNPEQPHSVPLPDEPRPVPPPEEIRPFPEEPHPIPNLEEPHPEPNPEEPHSVPVPEEPRPLPLPEQPRPVPPPEEIRPFPEEPHPIPNLEEPHPEPNPEEPHSVPVPEEPRPLPLPEQPRPVPPPEEIRPFPEEPHPIPNLEEPHPEPLPEVPRPLPLPEVPRPVPLPQEPRPVPLPEEPSPAPLPHKDTPLAPHPKPHPDHHHHDKPNINLPDIHITLPNIGKPKPGHPGHDNGLIDILNVLLKFPDRNSHPPKNIGSLIKLLLTILKPGGKQPDLENLSHLLLHLLDGHKEPNLNVLVEPGMDEDTRANLILLLQLLTNNLVGGSSYPMGYYQPENPLLYFLGHFPCDHPNIPAILQPSSPNLWQLLGSMYGHTSEYGQEVRLDRSAEQSEADEDKSVGEEQRTETK
ncbi:hypothetical protein PYW08_007949 [Mythimna loreyi]|uniref:Uncharacterized protein n=1 Tax=Mythimna loreyi TaxID=667449 RepID=A0ACC2QBY0_9NEOP|nr:hypothetical protein PYW08_007949 [Mythimna loreyi]